MVKEAVSITTYTTQPTSVIRDRALITPPYQFVSLGTAEPRILAGALSVLPWPSRAAGQQLGWA
jgi:hypothetical protein